MTAPRYSQAGVQALKHGEAAYRAGDRIVPARQARELLAAVEDLPPRHDCGDVGLGGCLNHPRWNVSREDLDSDLDCDIWGGPWGAYGPGVFGGVESFATHAEAIRYATSRARADQLAAITHSEGTDALPADLETP